MIKWVLFYAALFAAVCSGCGAQTEPELVDVPVLMYHHIDDNGPYATGEQKFRQDMEELLSLGYTPVFYQQIYDYVMGDGDLPDRPVVVTFDDGYASNYDFAWPIAVELGVKLEISVIGWGVELEAHPETGNPPSPPRLTWAQMVEMDESGMVRIQNHTYDLHGFTEGGRQGMLPLEDEDRAAYEQMILMDVGMMTEKIALHVGRAPLAMTYPGGRYNAGLEALIMQEGYPISVTTDYGIHTFVKGDESTLRLVRRISCDANEDRMTVILENALAHKRESGR